MVLPAWEKRSLDSCAQISEQSNQNGFEVLNSVWEQVCGGQGGKERKKENLCLSRKYKDLVMAGVSRLIRQSWCSSKVNLPPSYMIMRKNGGPLKEQAALWAELTVTASLMLMDWDGPVFSSMNCRLLKRKSQTPENAHEYLLFPRSSPQPGNSEKSGKEGVLGGS